MYTFFAIAFKVYKKCYYDQNIFASKILIWGSKNSEFHADFKFADADLKVHKIENFFGSEFEFYTISLLVMLK